MRYRVRFGVFIAVCLLAITPGKANELSSASTRATVADWPVSPLLIEQAEALRLPIGSDDPPGHWRSLVLDLNGDGQDDLVIANPNASPLGRHQAGVVHVFFASSKTSEPGPETEPDQSTKSLTLIGPHAHARLGADLAEAGRFVSGHPNALLASAPGADPQHSRRSKIFVVTAPPGDCEADGKPCTSQLDLADPQLPSVLRILPPASGRAFGHVLLGIGDFNGNGHDDIAIADPLADNADQPASGRLHILFGGQHDAVISPDHLPRERAIGINGMQSFGRFASSLAAIGDIHGHGFPSLAIGAPGDAQSGAPSAVHLLTGSSDVHLLDNNLNQWPSGQTVHIEGTEVGDGFGSALASMHLPGRDGAMALAVAAPLATVDGLAAAGRVYVIDSRALAGRDLAPEHGIELLGAHANAQLGWLLMQLPDALLIASSQTADSPDPDWQTAHHLLQATPDWPDGKTGLTLVPAAGKDQSVGDWQLQPAGRIAGRLRLLAEADHADKDRLRLIVIQSNHPVINDGEGIADQSVLAGNTLNNTLELDPGALEPGDFVMSIDVVDTSQVDTVNMDIALVSGSTWAYTIPTIAGGRSDTTAIVTVDHPDLADPIEETFALRIGEQPTVLFGLSAVSMIDGATLEHQFTIDNGGFPYEDLNIEIIGDPAAIFDLNFLEVVQVDGDDWILRAPVLPGQTGSAEVLVTIEYPDQPDPSVVDGLIDIFINPGTPPSVNAGLGFEPREVFAGREFNEPFTVDPGQFTATQITVAAEADPDTLIAPGTLTSPGGGTNWAIDFDTISNQFGTVKIITRVYYQSGIESYFVREDLEVDITDGRPVINNGDPVAVASIFEGQAAEVDFPVDDPDTSLASVEVTSSNQAVISDGNISVAPIGGNQYRLSIDTTLDDLGVADLSVLATNDLGTRFNTFPVEVVQRPAPEINDGSGLDPEWSVVGGETLSILFNVDDLFDDAADVLVSAQSITPSVLTDSQLDLINLGNGEWQLDVNPDINDQGTAELEVTASNSANRSVVDTTNVVISNRLPPSIVGVSDRTMTAGQTLQFDVTVDDDIDPPQDIDLSAQSGNPTLLPDSAISIDGTGAQRSISIDTDLSQVGDVTITLTATNSANLSVDEAFLLTIAARTPPSINAGTGVADQSVRAGQTVSVTVTLADDLDPAADISLSAQSGDTAILPNAAISIAGTGADRIISIETEPTHQGTVSISLEATNSDGLSTTESFELSILERLAPVINGGNGIPNQQILQGSTLSLNLTVDDQIDPATAITLTAQSNNPASLPNSAISLSGTGAIRTLNIDSRNLQAGSVGITVSATNTDGLSSTESFNIVVTALQAPRINNNAGIADQSVRAGQRLEISFQANDANVPAEPISVSAVSGAPNRLANQALSISGSTPNYQLAIQTEADDAGEVPVIVQATNQSGLSTQASFVLTITPIPPPVIEPEQSLDDLTLTLGSTRSIGLRLSDPEEPAEAITLQASSGDTAVLSNEGLTISGTGAQRQLQIDTRNATEGTTPIRLLATNAAGAVTELNFNLRIVHPSTTVTIDSERLATGGGEEVFIAIAVENTGNADAIEVVLSALAEGDLEIIGAYALAEDCETDAGSVSCDPDGTSPWVCSVEDGQMRCLLERLETGNTARGALQLEGRGSASVQLSALAINAVSAEQTLDIDN